MKVSELLETLHLSGIIKRVYIGYMDCDEFTGPYIISDIIKKPEFTDYRISTVKLWLIEPGMYETLLWIYI